MLKSARNAVRGYFTAIVIMMMWAGQVSAHCLNGELIYARVERLVGDADPPIRLKVPLTRDGFEIIELAAVGPEMWSSEIKDSDKPIQLDECNSDEVTLTVTLLHKPLSEFRQVSWTPLLRFGLRMGSGRPKKIVVRWTSTDPNEPYLRKQSTSKSLNDLVEEVLLPQDTQP